jgi:predicted nuclease of predicted toxin-antitoxin system
MIDPFLIDECLSPELARAAMERGFPATHVVYRKLQGTADHDLLKIAEAEGWVIVTNNGKDFLDLYKNLDLHLGLIIVVPGSLGMPKQVELFNKVLDEIELMADIVNKVVEVFSDGEVVIRDFPNRSHHSRP